MLVQVNDVLLGLLTGNIKNGYWTGSEWREKAEGADPVIAGIVVGWAPLPSPLG